jgi:hypothetical protein
MSAWPWPADSREDAAKRVALSYRHALEEAAAGDASRRAVLDALDEQWVERGAGWVKPTEAPLRFGDWLTAQEIAELFFITTKMVRNWGDRDQVQFYVATDGARRYRVGDVVDLYRARAG